MTYYYYGTKNETDFDAEGLLTSAVDAVLTDAPGQPTRPPAIRRRSCRTMCGAV